MEALRRSDGVRREAAACWASTRATSATTSASTASTRTSRGNDRAGPSQRLERHAPAGRSPLSAAGGRAATPTGSRTEQVRFFHEHGYVKGGRVLEQAQIDALRAGLEDIRTGRNPRTAELYEIDEDYRADPDRNVFHFLGAWLIDEAFHDLLFHPADHGEGGAAPGRAAGPLLARPGLLQAAPPPRGGDLAPGLFVLDAGHPGRTRHLLDRPGRRHPRERLPALRAGQPPSGACCRGSPSRRTWTR